MDPLSHAAVGGSLIALRPDGSPRRAAVVAAALGALSPDIDAVFMPIAWDLYLIIHEIGTHSLVGTLASGVLTAAVVRLVARSQPWGVLLPAAWAGAASHVLLDLVSSARLRVFWPMLDRQVSIPLVAMADPWLASLLIVGAGGLLMLHWRRRLVAMVFLISLMLFLLVKGALLARATGAYGAATAAGKPDERIVEARWAALSEWHVFDRSAGQLRIWRARGGVPSARLQLLWRVAAEDRDASSSRTLPAVRNFLRVHHLAFPVALRTSAGQVTVLWSDIRFCWEASAAQREFEPVVTAGTVTLACALWVGGEFDEHGAAVRQIVKVAGFTQTRGLDW